MKNVTEFLNYINGERENIIKVHKHIEAINRKSMVIIKPEDITNENQNGDIYFVVNDGSDKNNGITNFNALFIDFDAGRNNNDEYYSLDEVQLFKESIIDKLNKFDMKPTFIIETRNGYHVYWSLKGNVTIDQWKLGINKLIAYFDSDKQVNNPARLMRLPFTYWMKDKDNPYFVDIYEFNDVRYDIDTILDGLCGEVSDDLEKCGGNRISINKHLYTTTTKTPNTELIKSGDIKTLQSKLNSTPRYFPNQNEFYKYITEEINLSDFLGVSQSTCECVFHKDNNPSAGIFISDRNQYFYKCHSSNCGFMGNIIRCVERLRKCNRPKAINFIKEVYQLDIVESDWQKEQKMILEENKRMIRDGELEEYYPEIYKLIKNYKDLIYLMHDIAIDNTYDIKYSDSRDNVVFFVSITKLLKDLNYKNSKRISDRNALFAFLKLLNKLNEDEVPSEYLEKAIEQKVKNKRHYKVNFFSLPSYCDDSLELSLERARLYRDKNISMRGMSHELMQRTFGNEIANEVYPQLKNRKETSKSSNLKTSDIHTIVIELLTDKNYVMEKEVVESLREKYGKTQSEIQIKKSLQEMLDTYGLERIRCNKQIKEDFGVVSNGYPFLIVKK